MKQIYLVLLTSALFLNLLSQTTGKIKGVVLDVNGDPLPGANITVVGTTWGAEADEDGFYYIEGVRAGTYTIKAEFVGYAPKEAKEVKVRVGLTTTQDFRLTAQSFQLEELQVHIEMTEIKVQKDVTTSCRTVGLTSSISAKRETRNTEEYAVVNENKFMNVKDIPLSTFSIDVDKASYSNIRRFINQDQMPDKDAVRIEEMLNYFNYDYEYPKDDHPFAINTEIAECPWNKENRLVHIGLQGKKIEQQNNIKSNFVFLLDVSGSMSDENKLPLLKRSFHLLIDALKPEDRIAIVVYAGNAGLILPSTEVKEKNTIFEALDKLSAGGSTAGGQGIQLAYKIAEENLIQEGNNRIILATDGDFNVGVSDTGELVKMMEEKREKGIFLTILGFGIGNYKDEKMESIADKGNGNYFYIDNILEAKKILVTELAGTMYTIAKDVKIQVEFNPVKVESYRLIGYENRLLNKEDFDNDKIDAGELGAGHTVTALYEIVLTKDMSKENSGNLRYQSVSTRENAYTSNEVMNVKFRYKKPKGWFSKLIEHPVIDKNVKFDKSSDNFRFSAAVVEFGMLLKDSEFKGNSTFDGIIEMARGAKGKDSYGYRAEFIQLVEKAQLMAK
jgi:Ca-activated chloride channel family protein